MIFFGITELGNSICNKSATEPYSQDIRNIEDKHTPFRELLYLYNIYIYIYIYIHNIHIYII